MNLKIITELSQNENKDIDFINICKFIILLYERIEQLETELETTKENLYRLYRGED